MKKITMILALCLAGVMMFSLVGCSGDKTVVDDNNTNIEDTQKPEDVGTPEDTQKPEDATQGDETEKTEDKTEKVEVSIEDIKTTLQNTFGDYYLPGGQLDKESFGEMVGLDSDMYTDFLAEIPMMGFHADRLFVVKANDSAAVKGVFEEYVRVQVEDALQYPMNLPKWENNVVIYERDGFVILAVLGGYTDEMVEDDGKMTPEQIDAKNAEIQVNYYKAQNEKCIAALDALFTDGTIAENTASEVEVDVDVEADVEVETEAETETETKAE